MNTLQIKQLQKVISGIVATPGDPVYKEASEMLFHTVAPSVVVRPRSSEDVSAVITFAKQHALPFAVRSGGHGSASLRMPDDILLIDLRSLSKIEVLNAEEGLVQIETGALWHEVASKLERYDLAISSGDTRTVGVGGLTTGGGLGWMIRKYGPAVDSIVEAEVVTADGSIVKANPHENSDLFWAIRGGGGNFGIVTRLTFKAHRVEGIVIGKISYPLKDVAVIMKRWRDAMRSAPAELTTMFMTFPAMGETPGSIFIHGCYAGKDAQKAKKAYEPLLHLHGDAAHSELTPASYSQILEDGMPLKDIRVIAHADYIKEFSDEAIDAIAARFKTETPILQIRHLQGAMSRQPEDATAFSHRNCEVLVVHPTFVALDADEKEVEAALTTWRVINSFSDGMYLNLLTEDTGKEVAAGYSPFALKRLQKIKATYDPQNVFNVNYNITPSA